MLETRDGLGSNPGIDMLHCVLKASRFMESLITVPEVQLETFSLASARRCYGMSHQVIIG